MISHTLSTVVLLLSAAPLLNAAPAHTCTSFTLPVTVNEITTIVPPFPVPFPNSFAATSLANAITARDAVSGTPQTTSLTATFHISAEYCTPNKATAKSSTLQILTHGLGFDRKYWDFHIPSAPNDNQYSYITAALAAGYSTFSYDRLGCGSSTVADPFTEIQAPVELAILATMTEELREGKLLPKHLAASPPKKVLHVGHSWGSELSNALAATYPSLTDGVILTGFSDLSMYELDFVTNTAFHVAAENQPARFRHRSNGYLTWGDKYDNQYSFLAYPYFDPAVLEYAEAGKFPFTIGEFISQAALNFNASAFKGDVLFLAAQFDLIFCGSDCVGLFGSDSAARSAFPNAKSWEAYIQPNLGHGINLHYNATGAYDVIQKWAADHGY